MGDLRATDPVAKSFIATRTKLRKASLAATLALWDRTVAGPDDDTLDAWVAAWVPVREAAIVQTAVLTDAYVDAYLDARGIASAADPIDPDGIVERVRPGVTSSAVAERPIKTIRQALASGTALSDALSRGRHRLDSIAATDLQQAFRVSYDERTRSEPSIRAYRRVLVSDENCALCVIASTQRYRTGQLMPIHPGCDCAVEPIAGPVGQLIDRERLDEVQQLLEREGVSYGDRAQLANTKIRVNVSNVDDVTEIPHGELGPLLSVRQHRNTEISDLPAWVRHSRREFGPDGARTR